MSILSVWQEFGSKNVCSVTGLERDYIVSSERICDSQVLVIWSRQNVLPSVIPADSVDLNEKALKLTFNECVWFLPYCLIKMGSGNYRQMKPSYL